MNSHEVRLKAYLDTPTDLSDYPTLGLYFAELLRRNGGPVVRQWGFTSFTPEHGSVGLENSSEAFCLARCVAYLDGYAEGCRGEFSPWDYFLDTVMKPHMERRKAYLAQLRATE